MGIDLAGPDLFWKFLPARASVIDRAIEGFSATIITLAGEPILSDIGPWQ